MQYLHNYTYMWELVQMNVLELVCEHFDWPPLWLGVILVAVRYSSGDVTLSELPSYKTIQHENVLPNAATYVCMRLATFLRVLGMNSSCSNPILLVT